MASPKELFQQEMRGKVDRLKKLRDDPTTTPHDRQDIQLEIDVVQNICDLVNLVYNTRNCRI